MALIDFELLDFLLLDMDIVFRGGANNNFRFKKFKEL